ncbi:MAG: TIGR01212 family radical SAM protein [Pirellulaceae bacterium]|nr:TIGR01212 family radical SAM protein [Pirellulaceae bacterium]
MGFVPTCDSVPSLNLVYFKVVVPSTFAQQLSNYPLHYNWAEDGFRYLAYSFYLKQKFGKRVQRVSIDAGFTCPNADGTVAKGGCTFCDNRSFSPSRRLPRQTILEQINAGIEGLKRRYKCDDFIAYFQPATNTYAPVEKLRKFYDEALSHPKVIGLAIGTRADCVPEEVLDLLEEYAKTTYVTVEYGLQTIHQPTLDWMNRAETFAQYVDALRRSKGRGFEVCLHLMLGLPGETKEMMLETAETVAELPVDAVKIHNLYVVRRTELEKQYERGEIELLGHNEYIDILVDFLERLPPQMVIERISGEAPGKYFIAPDWCQDKSNILQTVEETMEERDSFQGKEFLARQGKLELK